ncbi:hypothetical protein L1276_000019 [Flavobacterium sp. HSC-32F16]|nr:hypothetical protein [Flavobacterium sp. HSC-32F16]
MENAAEKNLSKSKNKNTSIIKGLQISTIPEFYLRNINNKYPI